jgi:Domain of unknown function (DUF1996)
MVGLMVASGCGSTQPEPQTQAPELLAALAGPQGRVPQFIAECPFSHASFDDPIVHPSHEGASHLHHFFGNDSASADSTYASLIAGGTTCNNQHDTAAYWAPALLDAGKEVRPTLAVAYYRPGLRVDATSLVSYPADLRMVSDLTAWTCGTGSQRAATPPTCAEQFPLHLVVVFPDCWNGADIDSTDHRSHVAYSRDGACPATSPVPVPQLTLTVAYPVSGEGHELSLSSGDLATSHADFINSWDQEKLEADIKLCLARDVVCGVSG